MADERASEVGELPTQAGGHPPEGQGDSQLRSRGSA